MVNTGADSSSAYFRPMIDPQIFGSELFNNASLTFEPNLRIATPVNYEIGPDDELVISVYGLQEVSHSLRVSPEGTITIPQVGEIKMLGLTIETATKKIKDIMGRTAYSSLRSGGSKLSVTLGNIKSIKVTIIGGNKPGNFTVSSFTTAFNALFLAGGPSATGSFRQIELIRDGRIYKKIDLYRFLVNGDQSDNITLRNNDVIRIPAYQNRIFINGYVKRPGFFEVLPGETFNNMLQYSSGFSDSAYRASVKVTQFTDRELSVKDITAAAYNTYQPQPGDYINVEKILNRYANRVSITGAVFRSGAYELSAGMTVTELIQRADGLREDAYTGRAQIFRIKDDLSEEIISFDAASANTNIALKKNDSIVIRSIRDLRDDYNVYIQGEVRKPGYYGYSDSMTLKDILLQAGGLTDAAYPQKIEVARLIKRDTLTAQDVRNSNIIEVSNIDDLSSNDKNIAIKPFDVITVRRKPGYLPLQSVRVAGEVQYPGPYVLEKREERISDLIKRAGGFTPEAYMQGAYLKRYNSGDAGTQLKRQTIQKIQEQINDSANAVQQDVAREFDQIPLNVEKILADPSAPDNVLLQARDELYIPKFNPQVRISGSVLFPTQIPFEEKYNLKDYLSSAGGVAESGRKSKIYVLYANGKAASARSFLFFRSYPEIKPGTEIIVPSKAERKSNLSTAEVIGLSSALASLAGVVIAILRL